MPADCLTRIKTATGVPSKIRLYELLIALNDPNMTTPARKKPVPPDNSSQLWSLAAGALVLVACAVGGTLWFVKQKNPDYIEVQVTLDNRCELIDEAFMAVASPSGAKATFDKGLAVLRVPPRSKIYVKSNDKYPAFSFETSKYDAEPRMVITANCGMGERIDRTLDALKKQFKSRER